MWRSDGWCGDDLLRRFVDCCLVWALRVEILWNRFEHPHKYKIIIGWGKLASLMPGLGYFCYLVLECSDVDWIGLDGEGRGRTVGRQETGEQ